MSKTQKKIFGFFGLLVVFVITAIAITIPDLRASAVTSDTVTDTIRVRVLSSTPIISNLTGISNQQKVVDADGTISYDFESCEVVKASIRYVDGDTTKEVYTFSPTTDYGTESFTFNLRNFMAEKKFSYGQYIVTVRGEGQGASDEESVVFDYVPVIADVSKKTGQGDKDKIIVDYEPTPGDGDGGVSYIIVDIFDENDKKVTGDGLPIKISKPVTSAEIDFSKFGLEAGKYKLEINAFGDDSEDPLFEPVILEVEYDGEEDIDIVVPDTGSVYHILNIANKDYLITGLMIFFFLAIAGIVLIVNKNKKSRVNFSNKKR